MTRTGLLVALLVVGGPLQATARVLHVRPEDSIQAAVDAARSGDIVMIAPGTYHEAGRPCPTEPANTCAVVVDKDQITLMGQSARAGAVVLENSGDRTRGSRSRSRVRTAPRASPIRRSGSAARECTASR